LWAYFDIGTPFIWCGRKRRRHFGGVSSFSVSADEKTSAETTEHLQKQMWQKPQRCGITQPRVITLRINARTASKGNESLHLALRPRQKMYKFAVCRLFVAYFP